MKFLVRGATALWLCLLLIMGVVVAVVQALPYPGVISYDRNGAIVLHDLTRKLSIQLVRRGGHGVWSPDGGRLAFVSDAGMVQTVNPHTRETLVTNLGSYPPDIAWSADGDCLAFTTRIYFLGVYCESTGQQRYLGAEADVLRVDWSPDGERLVYATIPNARDVANIDAKVYLHDLQTNRATELVTVRARYTDVDFSPDGETVIYTSREGIYAVDVTTGASRQLSIYRANSLDVSPDGRWVVFDFHGDVYVVEVASGEVHPVAHTAADEFAPAWLP